MTRMEVSCNSIIRTNLEPEDDREVLRRIVCVNLKDDIHNPGEQNCQIVAFKEHVKTRQAVGSDKSPEE